MTNYAELFLRFIKHELFLALAVPFVLLFAGATAKKLVRGTRWKRSDFYLGVELSLAAMSAALVYLFDLSTVAAATPASVAGNKLAATAGYLTLCFALLFWILSTHQDWESQNARPKTQIVMLVFVSNFIGASLLLIFVLVIKTI